MPFFPSLILESLFFGQRCPSSLFSDRLLEAQMATLQRKLNELRQALILAEGVNPALAFSLKEQVAQAESELQQLKGQSRETGAVAANSQLATLSCDRLKVMRRFWKSFDEREANGLPLHFYFLAERPYGQADSLAKRLVANLKRESSDGVKFSGMDMLQPVQVVIGPGDEEEDCRYELRKAFNRSIHPQVRSLKDFADSIGQRYPNYQKVRYIPFLFKVKLKNADCWNRVVLRSLQWFIRDFCRLEGPQSCSFLFFFIIDMSGPLALPAKKRSFFAFGRKEKTAIAALSVEEMHQRVEAIAHALEEQVTVLPPLARIRIDDLDDWFYNVMKVHNQVERLQQVEALIEQLGGGEEWDMSPVEQALKRVVEGQRNRQSGI